MNKKSNLRSSSADTLAGNGKTKANKPKVRLSIEAPDAESMLELLTTLARSSSGKLTKAQAYKITGWDPSKIPQPDV